MQLGNQFWFIFTIVMKVIKFIASLKSDHDKSNQSDKKPDQSRLDSSK